MTIKMQKIDKNLYLELLESITEEEQAGIDLRNFLIYRIMQNYRIKNTFGSCIKGESIYDINAAIEQEELVAECYTKKKKGKKVRKKKELAAMLNKMDNFIKGGYREKGYTKISEPKNHPKGFVRNKETFDNRCFINLCYDIHLLRKRGEKLNNKIGRELQLKYNQKSRKDVDEAWKFVSHMTTEDLGLLKWTYKEYSKKGSAAFKFKVKNGQEITPEECEERSFGTINEVRKGIRLILSFNSKSSSLIGTIENVTKKTVPRVHVEIHLNRTNLETKPIDLSPGEKADVLLSADGQSFSRLKVYLKAGASEHEDRGI